MRKFKFSTSGNYFAIAVGDSSLNDEESIHIFDSSKNIESFLKDKIEKEQVLVKIHLEQLRNVLKVKFS